MLWLRCWSGSHQQSANRIRRTSGARCGTRRMLLIFLFLILLLLVCMCLCVCVCVPVSVTVCVSVWTLQLFRVAKCHDIVVQINAPIVRRAILAISGKIVETNRCRKQSSISSSVTLHDHVIGYLYLHLSLFIIMLSVPDIFVCRSAWSYYQLPSSSSVTLHEQSIISWYLHLAL